MEWQRRKMRTMEKRRAAMVVSLLWLAEMRLWLAAALKFISAQTN